MTTGLRTQHKRQHELMQGFRGDGGRRSPTSRKAMSVHTGTKAQWHPSQREKGRRESQIIMKREVWRV